MYQILFRIPTAWLGFPDGVPIYGYGMMLFVAFLACTWLAARRGQVVGIPRNLIQDLALWLFVGGLLGSRIVYLIHDQRWVKKYDDPITGFLKELPRIWDGGVVFYGGAIGGIIAYALLYRFAIRKLGIPTLKLADVVAPSIALGLCFGRIGCLLNGCCYGQPAPVEWYALHFPLPAPVRLQLDAEGLQTAAGFTWTFDSDRSVHVSKVEAGSPAYESGLREGDQILAIEHGRETVDVRSPSQLDDDLVGNWPRGENSLTMKVLHRGEEKGTQLPSFTPRTIGVQPTQIYESISMVLLFLLLMAYTPFRRNDGEVVALLMLGYGLHRTLNEMLRMDKRPGGLEVGVSLILIAAAVGLWIALRRLPAQYPQPAKNS